MIQITDKSRCCGCETCVQACPQQCITLHPDSEGFSYPQVDLHTCIQCNLCEKVCPVLHPYDEQKPLEVLAAINKEEEVRMASSSGGIFTLLAEYVIQKGGVVFGVCFDKQWKAIFDYAETNEEIKAFRGSKYLQAYVGNSFVVCKQMLEDGRDVLFSGSPCQIAGLKHFLGKPYPNLLTVDFICHGVPSPQVWLHYLKEVTKHGRKTITDIQFRDKRLGWERFCLMLKYSKHGRSQTRLSPHYLDPYMQAFLSNLILRPSCYSCAAKKGRSHADITMADFWNIKKIDSTMSDGKGTSLVMIHTSKGNAALRREKIKWISASYKDAQIFNSAVDIPVPMHPLRKDFFASFCEDVNLHQLITYYLSPTVRQRIKNVLYPFWVKVLLRK